MAAKANKAEEMRSILLPLIPDQDEAVFVSVNEKTYQVRRGEPVMVPLSVYEVLRYSMEAATANYRRRAAMRIG